MNDEAYIKMCDCAEIQGQNVSYSDGDRYAVPDGNDGWCVGIWCWRCEGEFFIGNEAKDLFSRSTWLPYQHQLQEMYGACNHIAYLCGLNDFAFGKRHGENMGHDAFVYPTNFHGTKELALAMLMQHKHNKIWSGETWIGDNDGK